MYVENKSGYAWYRTRTITIKLATGETLTGKPVEVYSLGVYPGHPSLKNAAFQIHEKCSLYQAVHGGTVVEVDFEGERYRVWSQGDGRDYAQLNCEPIGSVPVAVGNSPIRERILEALRGSPNGLTARQLEETLKCSRRAVFSALAVLLNSNRITKDGALYRAQEHSQ